mgnify:CR=1 FL=1
MASTPSTSLRLELMATGDQSGTWGDTTNTNLGTLLEQAITGVLSVAQGDVANLTLTNTDYVSNQARNAVINLTGAMTANRNMVVPTANKVYLVKNSTTGGFVVTVKTSAGTGVEVAPNTARWVYCDGTNVVDGLPGFGYGYATTATAAGTTTLTYGSARNQFFTGSTTQTVTLPVASTMTLGAQFLITNNSTGSLTVNSSGGNLVQTISAGTSALITNILTSGTSAASWSSTLYSPLSLTSTLVITGSTAGFVAFQGVSTEAGAAAGPIFDLYRNSATPTANDILGQHLFSGEDTAGNTQEYASIEAVIQTATSTAEDGALDFYATRAGTRTRMLSVGAVVSSPRGFAQGYTTTATAAGTTTLTVASTQQQFFTGSTTQTVVLPVTSTLILGQSFTVVNNSTGAVTVQSSGANNIAIQPGGTEVTYVVILTSGTTAASWSVVTNAAASLRSATTIVGVAAATAPSSGQVLTATSSTAATWQTPSGGLTLGTDTATTSGSTITFSSIPSGVKQITLSWRGGSTNNIGQIYVQIGDSGGLETTGYTGDTLTFNTTPTISRMAWSAGSGALLANSTNAATVWNATLVATLVNASTNTWSFSVTSTNDAGSGTAPGTIGAGNKSLSATLDRIAIITANTFDAGSVNIAYSS